MDAVHEPVLSAKAVGMRYAGVWALDDVSVDFFAGEVHAVVGENGAGKSTLMRILGAEERPSAGEILWDGQAIALGSPKAARQRGIGVVHQHFQLVDTLTVTENLGMGGYPRRGLLLDRARMRRESARQLALFGLESKADTPVRELSVAEKQMVEIVRALQGDSRVVIFDEPTASLGADEAQRLFAVMSKMREAGVAIILIAHNLDEVLSIADRITVLRNGRKIDTLSRSAIDRDELVGLMMGRKLDAGYPMRSSALGKEALALDGLLRTPGRDGVRLSLRRGEILGVPTYIGAQVEELLEAIVGKRGARVKVDGEDLAGMGASARIAKGIGVVPGDALQDALIPNMTIEENILLSMSRQVTTCGVLRRKKAREITMKAIAELGIRPADPCARVDRLSGGNRQKVVVAKWVAAGAKVMLLDDPTKAVDVGAKVDIFRLIHQAAEKGAAILFVSSEIEELVGMSHRIMLMHQGAVLQTYETPPFDKQTILGEIVGGRTSFQSTDRQQGAI